MWIYQFLDVFFLYFHMIVTLFCCTAWIWKKTRKINLALLLFTGFSWFILGIWFGFGYCVSTDWHWQVKHILGQANLPRSYVKYALDYFTGLDFDALLVDTVVMILFFVALAGSLTLNIRDFILWRKRKRKQQRGEGNQD